MELPPFHRPSRSDQIDQSHISDSPWQTPQKGMAVKVNMRSETGRSGPIVRVGGLPPSAGWSGVPSPFLSHRIYLLISSTKSTPPQNRQLILIEILSWRFCGGVDSLKLINKYIVSDKFRGIPCQSTILENHVRIPWQGHVQTRFQTDPI